jgi:pyrimidine-nucleoside phosphorylase
MRAVDIIRQKRDGQSLAPAAIGAFVRGAADGSWPDYQLTAMLMAICLRGMSAEETAVLTDAMTRSGGRWSLNDVGGPRLDKHSTGGVGDKVSLVLAPLVAACGGIVPMMSGRGLGHTGGTLDKLEAIPGFRSTLEPAVLARALEAAGCCIVGATADVAPADRRLYALRDVTATVDSIPLITASILSKKLAAGVDALVFDVKVGRAAFMRTEADARALADSLVRVAARQGLKAEAYLTAMDAPLGRAVGNALEVEEAVHALRGEGPADVEELSLALAARLLRLGGLAADDVEAEGAVREALASGRALERLEAMVAAQGGDARCIREPGRLPRAPRTVTLTSGAAGAIASIDGAAIGHAAVRLGAGRARAGDPVDPAAGVRLLALVGDLVAAGQPIAELHGRDEEAIRDAGRIVSTAIVVSSAAPPPPPLVLARVVPPS